MSYQPLSPRFAQACQLAVEVHGGVPRKRTTIPYVSHVLSVCALVMEYGGGEDEAIAARLVSCCDKLPNARCILRDYEALGDRLWSRFNATPEQTLWYYRELAARFEQAGPAEPAAALAKVIAELDRQTSSIEAMT